MKYIVIGDFFIIVLVDFWFLGSFSCYSRLEFIELFLVIYLNIYKKGGL